MGKKSLAVVVAPSSTKFPSANESGNIFFSFHLVGVSSFFLICFTIDCCFTNYKLLKFCFFFLFLISQ